MHHGIVDGTWLIVVFGSGADRCCRNTAPLLYGLAYLRTPLADCLGILLPCRFASGCIDKLGIDLFGESGKLGLLAKSRWWCPGLNAGAAPVCADEAYGNAALLLQLTAKVVAHGTKVGHRFGAARLPDGGALQTLLRAAGDDMALHIKKPDKRMIGFGNLPLWIV